MLARTAVALFALAPAAFAQDEKAIGADAVWAAPADFLGALHAACDAAAGAEFGRCFAERMESLGASAAAVAFARRTGDQGYLREFRDTGLVDVACAEYPFRANENAVCFLINGQPSMLDVDSPSLIDRKALLANPVFAGIAKTYPRVAIFPGPRSGQKAVRETAAAGGGQEFRVDYVLVDGCHACARVGTLEMTYAFDARGKFTGASVTRVRAGNP